MSESNVVLEAILQELKKLNEKQIDPYSKEWYPLAFHFLQKGYYVYDRYIGSSKWGFQQIWDDPIKYDFDYEFDSLYLSTENSNYKPAVRLVINGMQYPEQQRFASSLSSTPYVYHREYWGHNYNYLRCFQFDRGRTAQGRGVGNYPFKMLVKANPKWTLNFEFFQTSTNNLWHYLMIFGWKIHKKIDDRIIELEKLADQLND